MQNVELHLYLGGILLVIFQPSSMHAYNQKTDTDTVQEHWTSYTLTSGMKEVQLHGDSSQSGEREREHESKRVRLMLYYKHKMASLLFNIH